MGYSGLSSWIDSDDAAGFMSIIENKIAAECKKEFKNKANEYNTPGWVNIALMAEALLLKRGFDLYEESELYSILSKTKEKLESELARIKKEEDWGSKAMHVSAYKRMIKNLGAILSKSY